MYLFSYIFRKDRCNMEKLRTGALYIRVSTDKQEELSPDAQRRLLLEYAAKNNIILSNEYIFEEDGISGRKAAPMPNKSS